MTTIQHKRGTSTNWTSSNPTLAAGEIGYETDTGKFKIGDGASTWSALSYFEVASGAGSGTVTSITAGTGLSGGTITTSGTIALSHLGIESLTDPNADRVLFWDDSASSAQWLTLGTNLSISGTTINATDTNTTYTAGTGLTLSGTEFSVTANTYQPLDADLTAIAALSADGLLRKTSGTWGMDSATYLTSLGIGSSTQAWDADLDAVAALSGTGIAKRTGAGTWTTITDNSTNWDSAYTDRLKWDGGSTGLTASTGRTSLGATTVGSNLFTLTNPSATTFLKVNPDNSITTENASTHLASLGATTVGENILELTNPSAIRFIRINANNTVSALSDSDFRTAIGAGTGSGTVTTVSVASANGFAGTVANASSTPAITLSTTITGLLSGNGTAISAASVGYGDTTNPYGSKTTNYVLAGPAGGPSAAPTFRALVSADIPDLSGTYLVVGGNAATATTATNANNINISTTDGNTSDTTMYPVFVGANTTGNQLPHTDVSGFSYNASTNAISTGSISLTGALSAVTTITGISGTTLAISAGGTAGTASSLTGGANTSTTGVGGAVSITGGAATVGTSTATGGSVSIVGGASNTTAGVGGSITINGGLGSSANGNGTISIGTSNTDTITLGESGKVVNFAGAVDLRAGGTTANTAPLYFSSSTSVLATPVAGAVEYNNANFFATPFTTSGRALIESTYFYSNQSTISIAGTSTGGAAISGSAFGVALPLATSTTYQIEAALYLQTSYSTNAPASQTMTFSYPTGTTILTEGIIVQNQAAVTTQTTAGSFYAMQANTNRTITAVTTSGNWHRVSMRGIIRTSTTAGSFSINFGGTNGATPATLQLTLGANSYIKLTPVGSATADNSIGAWA